MQIYSRYIHDYEHMCIHVYSCILFFTAHHFSRSPIEQTYIHAHVRNKAYVCVCVCVCVFVRRVELESESLRNACHHHVLVLTYAHESI